MPKTNKTKAQLQAELDIALAQLQAVSESAIKMREIVSIQKCLTKAREVLSERGGDAELLAEFISRVWWIDLRPEDITKADESTG